MEWWYCAVAFFYGFAALSALEIDGHDNPQWVSWLARWGARILAGVGFACYLVHIIRSQVSVREELGLGRGLLILSGIVVTYLLVRAVRKKTATRKE